jgi:hypothetical protein
MQRLDDTAGAVTRSVPGARWRRNADAQTATSQKVQQALPVAI